MFATKNSVDLIDSWTFNSSKIDDISRSYRKLVVEGSSELSEM